MGILYSAIPAVILFFQGTFFKVYALKGSGKNNETFFNLLNFALCFLITLPFAFIGKDFDWISVGLGGIHGVLFSAMVLFYNKAMSVGKIAFNNFVMALSMIIPITLGAVILGEEIGVWQWIGLVVFFVASYLVCFGQRSDDSKKTSGIAYVYIAIAAVAGGCLSLAIKLFHAYYPKINQMLSLDSAFLVSALLMLVLTGASVKFRGLSAYFSDKWFIICLAVVAVATSFGNITFNIYSVKVVSAIFYPIANGMPMVLAVIVSPIFKEKISLMSVVGIAVGIGAVVLLNI